jgi:hypothetical protein
VELNQGAQLNGRSSGAKHEGSGYTGGKNNQVLQLYKLGLSTTLKVKQGGQNYTAAAKLYRGNVPKGGRVVINKRSGAIHKRLIDSGG